MVSVEKQTIEEPTVEPKTTEVSTQEVATQEVSTNEITTEQPTTEEITVKEVEVVDRSNHSANHNDNHRNDTRTTERSPSNETPRERTTEPKQTNLVSDKGISKQNPKKVVKTNATYYTASCNGCSGFTATGQDVRGSTYVNGKRVIAVDPNVIPLGSTVRVTTGNGEQFEAIAGDTGGAIKGNKIDILVGDKSTARSLGRTSATVEVLK
ncbi:3D domain-containing protein [Abyssicoccus albus]|uniref:3D (Asp-Asp-Asp) domain-containing protein n=1 Tax=Abyssicoccus albus TaxID=1817405 RepID=A0A3N5BAG5_9BACL|nr:3D domain-containing protein [Abyssicoccus albus]RPF54756.1 3D (Asp-Asp-Asp) domain-containing protein [Abyssicoccus albus]